MHGAKQTSKAIKAATVAAAAENPAVWLLTRGSPENNWFVPTSVMTLDVNH